MNTPIVEEAMDPKTSPARLRAISGMTQKLSNGVSLWLQEVSKNPNIDVDLAMELAATCPKEVFQNPSLDLWILEDPTFWEKWHPQVLGKFVKSNLHEFVNKKYDLFVLIMFKNYPLLEFFLKDAYKSFSREKILPVLEELNLKMDKTKIDFGTKNLTINRLVSIIPFTPAHILQSQCEESLRVGNMHWLLGNIAIHPNTNAYTLELLRRHGDEWVRGCLAGRQDYIQSK